MGLAYYQYDTASIASALAAILAHPIYLLVSRTVARDLRSHPEKMDLPVRKWLTYIALVIAASVFMGDLITALAYLLRGQLTSRFLSKALSCWRFRGAFSSTTLGACGNPTRPPTPGRWSRDASMAAVSAAGVVLTVILHSGTLGAPQTQRTLRADAKRVQDLFQSSGLIDARWRNNGHMLPAHLDEVRGVTVSYSVTGAPYELVARQPVRFVRDVFDGQPLVDGILPRAGFWSHPAVLIVLRWMRWSPRSTRTFTCLTRCSERSFAFLPTSRVRRASLAAGISGDGDIHEF